jgi:ABC-type sulfate transport system permease subunit
MVLTGIAFLIFWGLQEAFSTLTEIKAALITAVIFIILGIILGERPFLNRRD